MTAGTERRSLRARPAEVHSLANADLLSHALDTVRFTGSRCFGLMLRGEWAVETPSGADLAAKFAFGREHVMFFRVVTEGWCWSRLGERRDRLAAGDIVIYVHGHRHILANADGRRPTRLDDIVPPLPWPGPGNFVIGDGVGPGTRMFCGFLRCETYRFNSLLAQMPPVLIIPAAKHRSNVWLAASIEKLSREVTNPGPGSDIVTRRLIEVMFVSILRHLVESGDPAVRSWTAAAGDPVLARALRLIHEAPARRWTGASLASACATSRSRLAHRFRTYLRCGPMEYATQWRLQRALHSLHDGATSVAQAAHLAGYDSEAAFSRAFKRTFGVAPSDIRANGHCDQAGSPPSDSGQTAMGSGRTVMGAAATAR